MALRKRQRPQRMGDVPIPVPHSSWSRGRAVPAGERLPPEEFWARLGD